MKFELLEEGAVGQLQLLKNSSLVWCIESVAKVADLEGREVKKMCEDMAAITPNETKGIKNENLD